MSRRHEIVDEYAPGNEDYEYDRARQQLVDAECEGELAGVQGKASSACPYHESDAQFAAWHQGWLRETLKREPRRKTA